MTLLSKDYSVEEDCHSFISTIIVGHLSDNEGTTLILVANVVLSNIQASEKKVLTIIMFLCINLHF